MAVPFTRREFLLESAAAAGLTVFGSFGPLRTAHAKGAMKTYKVPNTNLAVSRIGYGCAWLTGQWGEWEKDAALTRTTVQEALRMILLAYDSGITLFDHGDIYDFGKAESAFGQILKKSPGLREKIVIQSKCGIRLAHTTNEPAANDPIRMDFSHTHIVSAVEGSLKRLGTDRLDILLLHRPDALVEPDEVASAFDELHRSGKVRYFGVSNHNWMQIELLKKSVRQPLVINQVQLGLAHSFLIADAMEFNRGEESRLTQGYSGAVGTLDYCRLNDIQIQAWSPLAGVPLKPLGPEATPEMKWLAQLLGEMAAAKSTRASAISLAWLLRHPAGILPITGPMKPEHLLENCAADDVELTREEWYALLAAGLGVRSLRFL